MAAANSTPIILYNSGATGNTPLPANLAFGELALNYADGLLFYKNGSGTVSSISSMVYPSAGIPNSTGTAWGTSYTTSGSGTVVALTAAPTLSAPVIGGANPYMDMTPTAGPAYQEGRVFYDTNAKTLAYYNDNSQMTVNLGQEQIIRVRNQTGSIVPNGTVVYINGASANAPTIALAQANTFNGSDIIGVTTTDINNNGFGYVTTSGVVNGLDTSAFNAGDKLFVSPTTPGGYTTTMPTSPNYAVQVGVVIVDNASTGAILVAVELVSVDTTYIVGTVAVTQGGTGATTAAGARTNLGLGTIATQDASSVAITGGTINNTVIGGTTPAAITGTTITATTGIFGGTF